MPILYLYVVELAKECVAVTLFLGSNDANVHSLNPNHHVPLKEYKESLVAVGQYLLVWETGFNRKELSF